MFQFPTKISRLREDTHRAAQKALVLAARVEALIELAEKERPLLAERSPPVVVNEAGVAQATELFDTLRFVLVDLCCPCGCPLIDPRPGVKTHGRTPMRHTLCPGCGAAELARASW